MKNLMMFLSIVLFACVNLQAQDPDQDWFHQDPMVSQYPGIATDKTYKELLEGRSSETIIVAVIDSGVDAEHEDLADIMWVNSGEIPDNGIDDDKNGYVDDVHGWNFIGGADGRNVNDDTLEAARLYKKYHYKYKDASRDKLSKDQKKEYDHYLKVKENVEGTRTKAEASIERINNTKGKVMSAIDAIATALDTSALTAENVTAIEAGDNEHLIFGKSVLGKMFAEGETISSIEELREGASEQFQGGLDHYEGQLAYNYNPDFEPRNIVGDNYDDINERYYGNNNVEGPDALHGTHVAGIIAAIRNNNIGMNGVADNVRIMSVRAVPNGDERDKDVANAIRYAVDNGASIINMSFGKGFSWNKQAVDEAVHHAQKNDVLLVHAAGNSHQNNDSTDNFPNDTYEKGFGFWFWKKKKCKNWLEVGALNFKRAEDIPATFSNYGKANVDVFAPGVKIYSTLPDDEYRFLRGTSMASPVVAGVAAVLRGYFPTLTAEQVKDIIMNSSVKYDMDVYLPGDKTKEVPFSELSKSGGTINMENAVKMALTTKGKKKIKKKKPSRA